MTTALAKAKGNSDSRVQKRDGWGNRFAMDARTKIKSRLRSRQATKGPSRAPYVYAMGLTAGGSTDAALQPPVIAHEGGIADTFKKTLCVADLKPRGRYVAKDKFEIGGIIEIDIEIDADVGTLNVKLTGAELAERKTKWMPRATNHTSGALWKYAQQVGPAEGGAVAHPGGAYEKQCYADI